MPTIKELRQICQHSAEAPSWRTQSLEGKFNRIFSIYLTWVLARTKIPVTVVNVSGMMLYIGGAFLFIFNDIKWHFLGLFLMLLSFIFDATDGELSRYRKLPKRETEFGGGFIEPVSHDIMYAFFFLPLGIGTTLVSGSLWPLLAAFMAVIGKLLFRLLELRADALLKIWAAEKGAQVKWIQGAATPTSLLYFAYRNFFTGTGMFFILIPAAIFSRVDWFLYFYGTSFFLLWAYKMAKQWKKMRKEVNSV
ncbi:MAG: hypothetical protein WC459_00515 [Patescibacteria group bacterium]